MKIWDITLDDEIREGDEFDLELGDILVETTVHEVLEDGVVIHADAQTLKHIMEFVKLPLHESEDMEEAKYQGREVPLGKPMAGDVKKSNPKRRKSFRARHNCDNPGPRWKARYWSCRAW